MENHQLNRVHGVLTLVGIGLMLGGVLQHRPGAIVVGMIVASVNAQLWRRSR